MGSTLEAAHQLAPPTLADDLDRHFILCRADTPELRAVCHRLRFEVYCVDNPFESAAESRDGLERDALDQASEHALVVHRDLKIAVGTVRLVLPARLEPPDELPFQRICGYRDPMSRGLVPPNEVGEVSRIGIPLRVRRLLRGASGASRTSDQRWSRELDPANGLPLLMLYRGFLMLAAESGVSHLCALIEPPLLRHYARLGIFPRPVGPLVDYHGVRQPCFSAISELLEGAAALRPDVWQAITDRGRLARFSAPRIAAE